MKKKTSHQLLYKDNLFVNFEQTCWKDLKKGLRNGIDVNNKISLCAHQTKHNIFIFTWKIIGALLFLLLFFFVVTQINNRNSGLQTEQKCIDWSNE